MPLDVANPQSLAERLLRCGDICFRAFWLVLASVWCQKGLGPVTRTVVLQSGRRPLAKRSPYYWYPKRIACSYLKLRASKAYCAIFLMQKSTSLSRRIIPLSLQGTQARPTLDRSALYPQKYPPSIPRATPSLSCSCNALSHAAHRAAPSG